MTPRQLSRLIRCTNSILSVKAVIFMLNGRGSMPNCFANDLKRITPPLESLHRVTKCQGDVTIVESARTCRPVFLCSSSLFWDQQRYIDIGSSNRDNSALINYLCVFTKLKDGFLKMPSCDKSMMSEVLKTVSIHLKCFICVQ